MTKPDRIPCVVPYSQQSAAPKTVLCPDCPNELGCLDKCQKYDLDNLTEKQRKRFLHRAKSLASQKTALDISYENALSAADRLRTFVNRYGRAKHCFATSRLPMDRLKRQFTRRFYYAREEVGKAIEVLNAIKGAVWFDFRFVRSLGGDDMAAFGKELVEAGIVHLPYERCVFVFSASVDEKPIEVAAALVERNGEIETRYEQIYEHGRQPIGVDCRVEPSPLTYKALAILASREAIQKREWDDVPIRSASKEAQQSKTHRRILIRSEIHNNGASGAGSSRRMHWRRGHIRKYRSGRVTWIRATLVGKGENIPLPKDYEVEAIEAAVGIA